MSEGAGPGWGGPNLRNAARFEDLQRKITDLRAGRLFPVGEVELASDGTATTTTVKTQACSKRSVVILMPKEADAAAELATLHIEPGTGEFIITHSAGTTVRKFRWAILGPATAKGA